VLGRCKIRCPACSYKPRPEDRWACTAECGTVWHTFWTGGVCPGCAHPWKTTQCPACDKVSPHRAWYHLPSDESARRREADTLSTSR
jgi:hypothetical protein